MKPDLARFFEILAAHLMTRTAPAVGAGYEQSSLMIAGLMLTTVSEEVERAAARRVEENTALRQLFSDAAPVVTDLTLRGRVESAALETDDDLRISVLEAGNARLRALLIELHSHVEDLDGDEPRRIEQAIWHELVASTERRRLAIAMY